MRKTFFLIFAIICLCKISLAQPITNLYNTITEEKWLPRQSIHTIFQDAKGNMWVGTNAGLYKYNLFAAVNYNLSQKTTDRLLNNNIHTINEDAKGNILVGTESGLGLLDPVSGNFSVLTTSDETILEIVKGSDGVLWMLNGRGDVFRLGTDASQIKKQGLKVFVRLADAQEAAAKKASTIFVMPGGNVLIGTNGGLYQLNTQQKTIKATAIKENITRLFAHNDKTLYIGTTDKGLLAAHLQNKSINNIQAIETIMQPGNYITGIFPLDKQSVVVASSQQIGFVEHRNGKLFYNNITTNETIFSEGSLFTGFIDRTDNIWLGSKRGLYKMKRQALNASFLNVSAQAGVDENVTDIFFDGNEHLFTLTASSTVTRMNVKTGNRSPLLFPFASVYKMRQAANGAILLFANRKVIEIKKEALYADKVNDYRVLYNNEAYAEINDMREVLPGEFWVTSWNGDLIRVMQDATQKPSLVFATIAKQFNASTHLFSLIADKQGNVWIATRGEGLFKLNMNENTVKRYQKKDGLSNRLICLKQDSKGNVWIGSRGDGLFLYNQTQDSFMLFDTKAGLPSNTICAIEETSAGELWISTLNGLARYRPGQIMAFTSFGAEDGINNPEHNFNVSATDDKGTVYFGNGNGIYKVMPLPAAQSTSYPVAWTQFELLNENGTGTPKSEEASAALLNNFLSTNNAIVLAHDENNIRIGFASLDFTTPEKNRYAYRLLGKDSAWQFLEGTKQSVQYFDLSPGTYQLQVKSATATGEWTAQPETISFIIQPWFWASRGGYTLYVIVFISALVIAFFLRRRWLRLQKKLEQEIHSGQLHNQQMVFYTDLSHEIKNRITLILGPLEQALHGKKVNQSVLTNLYDQGLRLKKLTDQIMNIRKRESGSFLLNVAEENIGLRIEELCREAEPMAVLKNVRFSFTGLQNNINGWCDEELLEIVVMNLLSNAVKYCKVNGSVEVKIDQQYLGKADEQSLEFEGTYLICSVTDTGIGIPQADIEKITAPFFRAENIRNNKKEMGGTGIGLDLVARIVKMHHGHLEIRSELGEFTTVTFYLPLDKHCYRLNELKPNLDHAPVIIEAPTTKAEVELIVPAGVKAIEEISSKKQEWTVLLVDDNPEILNLLVSILEEDFKLVTAGNGEEALTKIKGQEINLVLSDLDMPVMDGLTLCRKLKDSKETKHIPFLILTGRNSEEQKLVCFIHGVDDFIEKPFSNELLRWRVKSLLRSSAQKGKLKTVVVVEPKPDIPQNADDKFIQEIINLIEKNIAKDFLDVDFLAENLYTSRATFYRRMEQLVGESPSVFIRKYRLKRAALLLEAGHSMAEVANKTGFSSAKYFSKCFQKEFGVTPGEFAEREEKT